jgi:hypothetical protein
MGGILQRGSGRRTRPQALDAAGAARSATASRRRSLTASDAAWLAAIPTAAIALPAIALLGPPLGRTLFAPPHVRFWEQFQPEVRPEAAEHGRYLVALLVPLLLATLTVALARLRRPPAAGVLAVAVQAAVVGAALACALQQRELFGPLYPQGTGVTPRLIDYFDTTTLVVAAAATVALSLALANRRLSATLSALTRETPRRHVAATGVAVVAIAIWLLPGFNTEETIRGAHFQVLYHIQFTMDETYAVLDGRSPLVNFAAQYGSLWSYAFAATMSLLGDTVGVWIGLALTATGLGMLSIYAVLRRAAGSSIRGLLLFLPIPAASFVLIGGTLERRYSFGTYFGTFPMRFAGPSILAWLVARHLGGAAPRRPWALFLVAGLVALNNADVGAPAIIATAAALLWSRRPTRERVLRLTLEAAGGLAAAFALVSCLTLARAGALPDLGLLLRFSRIFAASGFGLFPMPRFGLHLVIYVTFVAALGVATVRALGDERDRLLTGMLAWSAVFGLGAGAYFVGRSTADDLPAVFLPWSFALALLLIPAASSLRSASWRRPPVAAVACLFAFLMVAGSLRQTPTPWEQLHRLQRTTAPILARPHGQGFIAQHTRPGEHVVITGFLGHRIGENVGVVNVSPYSNSLAMATVEQLDETIAALRASGGRKLFLDLRLAQGSEVQHAIEDAGLRFAGIGAQGRVGLWIDRGGR